MQPKRKRKTSTSMRLKHLNFLVPIGRRSASRFGLGVPAGLFVPSLLTGAVLGRFVGEGLRMFLPEARESPRDL